MKVGPYELDDRLAASRRIERLAQWWTQATQEARFDALRRSFNGDPSAPTFQELQLALLIAEAAQGAIGEG